MNGEDVQRAMEIRNAMENGFEPMFLEGILAMHAKDPKAVSRLITIAGNNSRRRAIAVEEEAIKEATEWKEQKSRRISINSRRMIRQKKYMEELNAKA